MRIAVATSAPVYWQPQAEAFAEAMRSQGHEAGVATPQSLQGLPFTTKDTKHTNQVEGQGAALRPALLRSARGKASGRSSTASVRPRG